MTSEGSRNSGIAPFVRRYSLGGAFLGDLPVPAAFLPTSATHGVRQNLAFEAAAVAPNGRHLYVGMEGALAQDGPAATSSNGSTSRILRYNLASGRLERQDVYVDDPVAEPPVPATNFSVNGLVELLRSTTSSCSRWSARSRSARPAPGNTIKLYYVSFHADDERGRRSTASPGCATLQPRRRRCCSTCARSASRSTTSRA